MTKRTIFGLVLVACCGTVLVAQEPGAAPVKRHDPALEAAESLVGRALILRCFCADNNLGFDADGHPQQAAKATDWTLAGVNVQRASRKDAGTVELDGVRVAIRYAADRREFDRHPLNTQKVKILVEDNGKGAAFDRTLDAVFSEGMDLRLQRAMPTYWEHYFLPQSPWPKDGLEDQTIVTPGAPGAPAGVTDPRPIKRGNGSFTPEATQDHVQGAVLLRTVVDTAGVPERVTVAQPLGYGLDAKAVQAIEKYHFEPATTTDGKAVASNVLVRQEFTLVPAP